ncbi:MAG: DUF1232 domain-containing protein [Elusimicrobiota bacterium]|nr:DUF1232 domain-containing protein [Elusimicrobiota bacterium]
MDNDKYQITEVKQPIKKTRALDWIFFAAAIVYVFLPVDIIPDIPAIGWIDDSLILMSAGSNLIQKGTAQSFEKLSAIFKILKYILLSLFVIIVLLAVFTGAIIIKTIKG